MKSLKLRLESHFVAAAAMAAVAAVGAGQKADAAIVYSGIVNIPIQQTVNGLYINIVTGQINEPGNTGGSSVPGWDLNPYGSTQTFYGFGNTGWAYCGTAGVLGQLAAGAPIDSTTATNTSSASASAFPTTGGAYFGFRFQNEAAGNQIQNAWGLYIKPADANSTGTLVAYAYEDSGAGIAAGAVPTPGSLALLGLGGLGLTRRRRR